MLRGLQPVGRRLLHGWAPLARPTLLVCAPLQLCRRGLALSAAPAPQTVLSLRLSSHSSGPAGLWLRGAAFAVAVGSSGRLCLGTPAAAAAAPPLAPLKPSGIVAPVQAPVSLARRIARRLFYLARAVYLWCVFMPLLLASPLAFWQTRFPFLVEFWWSWCVATLERTGALVIKLAQWASSRPDLFGEGICGRFLHLQDRTPPHSLAQTEATLDAMFGPRWRDTLVIDPEPIGSGCIAQVNRTCYYYSLGIQPHPFLHDAPSGIGLEWWFTPKLIRSHSTPTRIHVYI